MVTRDTEVTMSFMHIAEAMKGFRARWRSSPYREGEGPEDDSVDKALEQAGQPTASASVDPVAVEPAVDHDFPRTSELHRVVDPATASYKPAMLYPWEQGMWANVFSAPRNTAVGLSHFVPPLPVPLPAVSHITPAMPLPSHTCALTKKLRKGDNDDPRQDAINKLKTLVVLDPSATKAGKLMRNSAGLDVDPASGLQILVDIVAPKSTGTLTKRVGSLWRYATYLLTINASSPFGASEQCLYDYLVHLRGNEAGATAGSSVLEALRLANALLGFEKVSISELDSPHVRGAAHSLFMTKRRRRQPPPLPVKVVRHLIETCLSEDRPDHVRVISGHLCLCIFSVARWSDLRLMDDLTMESSNNVHLFEASSREYKTAYSKEQKVEILPFLGLGAWPHQSSWAECLIDLRGKYQLDGGLPHYSDGRWARQAMTTSTATAWLRELAQEVLGVQAKELRAHSLKTTLLTWAGLSSIFTREEQTLLGHHVEASTKSATTYDRDAIVRLQAKVHRVLQMIQSGALEPDASRAKKFDDLLKQTSSLPDDIARQPGEDSSSEDEPDKALAKPLPIHREFVPPPPKATFGGLTQFPELFMSSQVPCRIVWLVAGSCPATSLPSAWRILIWTNLPFVLSVLHQDSSGDEAARKNTPVVIVVFS